MDDMNIVNICGTSRTPEGWYCSRSYWHRGPCAARPIRIDEVLCCSCFLPMQKNPDKSLGYIPCEHCSLKRMMRQVDDVLTDNWIVVKKGDYKAALNELVGFNVQIPIDPAVNGGDTMFTKAECKLLHTLVDGYVVGPDVRKVLIKLKEAASL